MPWDWLHVSRNPNISWDIIKNNPTKRWFWSNISKNPSITLDIIQSNLVGPSETHMLWLWNWYEISMNPNITWDIIKENPSMPWKLKLISKNPMIYELSTKKKIEIAREYFAQKRITRYWRECISNPAYLVCKRRLIREFAQLI